MILKKLKEVKQILKMKMPVSRYEYYKTFEQVLKVIEAQQEKSVMDRNDINQLARAMQNQNKKQTKKSNKKGSGVMYG